MDDAERQLTIGQVADAAGIAPSSIRYYESIGLLPEPEREYGQRRYGPDVLRRLEFIGVSQQAGFTLREIKELSAGYDGKRPMAGPLQELASSKLPEVEALMEQVKAMRQWLEVAQGCGCTSVDDCSLFDGEGAAGELPKLVQVGGGEPSCRKD